MNIALVIILFVICALLGAFVLIQNPKGGGLAGNLGGLGQQMMGVQQSTDSVEKGTWILGALMGLLCILMVSLGNAGSSRTGKSQAEEAVKGFTGGVTAPATAPAGPSTATPATAAPATSSAAPATATAPASGGSAPATTTNAAPATSTNAAAATNPTPAPAPVDGAAATTKK